MRNRISLLSVFFVVFALVFGTAAAEGANSDVPFNTAEFFQSDQANQAREVLKSTNTPLQKHDFRMDYNSDGKDNSQDIILLMAWFQITSKTHADVFQRAQQIWAGVDGPMVFQPTVPMDDLNNDGVVDSQDAAILIAWYQVATNDRGAILARAQELYPQTRGSIVRLPNERITHDVELNKRVSGLNSYNLQVHLHNVPTDFNTSAFLNCFTVAGPSTPICWGRSPNISLPDGAILVSTVMEPCSVDSFRSLSFTNHLPEGAFVEVINRDNGQIVAASKTMTSILLNPTSVSVTTDGTYNLHAIIVTALFSDQTSHVVPNVTWSVKSGNGSVNNNTFTAPAATGIHVLACIYTETGVTVTQFLKITVVQSHTNRNFITKWGHLGSGNAQFNHPIGIAIDAGENVFVAEYNNHRIQKLDSSGNFITKWGTLGFGDGQFNNPTGIAVDSAGNVFVTDYLNHRIQKFDSTGNFITKWGTQGSRDGQFDGPHGIAIDAGGNVFVADHLYHRVQKFDSTGNFITKWGSLGSGNGQFNHPTGIAVDSTGNVFVSDYLNHRIQKFDSNGNFITMWGNLGSRSGQFNEPIGIAIDGTGNLFVSDCLNHRIQKFDSKGNFITKWGSPGWGNGQFDGPDGIAFDAEGNVFISDSGNDRIQEFNTNGNFINKWGESGK
ncbi:MAG: hypothetical protein WA705_14425 [Candidatus Ozemobacteraceae bacterium]